MVSREMYDLDASKDTRPDRSPAIVLKMCSPELSPVPGKYRPISLLPIISKIFESFIHDSLTKHLDITGLFSDVQYSFRAFLTVLRDGKTRAIALDISKAFDKVWHA